jgi:hypothetical protein
LRFRHVCLLLVALFSAPAAAVPPSDTLLPQSTKGFVSIAKPTEFRERWEKTQLGQMWNDETMQPFVEDFEKQMGDKYQAMETKLGVKFDDIKGVSSGELSLALIERKGQDAALAMTMDVTGHAKQADTMLTAVEKRFTARGGKKTTEKLGDATLQVFQMPALKGGGTQTTVYFIKDDLLCGIDDRAEAEAILKRFDGTAKDNLKSIVAYQVTMERCQKEAKGLEPEARWFVEPFGFFAAAKTLRTAPRERDGQDFAKILQRNGFDAVQGAGGYANQLLEGKVELLDRTFIYAPPAPGKENDPLRWNLSMRMMQLPNVPGFEPQSWAQRMCAGYTTISISIMDAFDNLGPLFDDVQEHKGAWKNSLYGWEHDAFGPKVNVREEFVANMNNRVTLLTDYNTPITTESERSLFAVEAKDEKALAKTLEKWMSREPDVTRHVVGPYVIWERTPHENAVEELQVEAPGFTPVGSSGEGGNATEGERVLPNSAVTVAFGHLFMASDINFLKEVLAGFGQRERLASAVDYQQVLEAVNQAAPGERSVWHFGRGDEEMRPVWELIRQNRMPEAKSMLGKTLNKILTTEIQKEQGEVRKQRIDGSSLPNFEAVRRYFGAHGRVARSDKDGWFVTGVLLNKEAP